jgi:hypothetical protein
VESELPHKVELATDFFLDPLGSARHRDHSLDFEALGLGSVDLSSLEVQFTEAGVWDAIKAMPTNKSPGPDGFTWEFYRHCWQVVKDDVMVVIRAVWLGHDQGFEVLNEALITLLPKKVGAVDLEDFRPITLVHSFVHLLTKVMARHLAPRMNEVVGENQTAFIQGRCIQDNFLLVRESTKLLHRKKIPTMLLEIDIAKAFDSIAWPFLLSVLHHRGFGLGGYG